MTGLDARVKTHGTMLSILFARAISIAAALKGLGKRSEGVGMCGVTGEVASVDRPAEGRSAGVIRGEEKQRRYRAMKKSSLSAQQVKRKPCDARRCQHMSRTARHHSTGPTTLLV